MTTTATNPGKTTTDDTSSSLDKLRELRDEVKVKLHLGGMEAKAEWDKLEPYLLDAEKAAENAAHNAGDAIKSAVDRLGKLRDDLVAKAKS